LSTPSPRYLVLGPLVALPGGHPVALGGPRPRALLTRLLLEPGRIISTDRLVDDLWDGEPPASAVNTLQTYVSGLRRGLGDLSRSLIVRESVGYRLEVAPADIDSRRFEQLVTEGRAALSAGLPDEALTAFDAGLGLWRGPALAPVATRAWARSEAMRLDEMRADAAEDRAEALLDLGRHTALVADLEAAVAEHPLRERRARQLALALYRSGRPADALRSIARTRAMLADELGLDPTPELAALEQLIQDQASPADAPGEARAERTAPDRAAAPDGGAAGDEEGGAGAIGAAGGRGAAEATPRQREAGEGDGAVAGSAGRSGGAAGRVGWERMGSVGAGLPLPAAARWGRGGFVGHADDLAWLAERWQAVVDGGRSLVIVEGEPGIGKTRLAAVLAQQVHAGGAPVVWGACPPEPVVAYQPVVEALREVARLVPQERLDRALLGNAPVRELLQALTGDPHHADLLHADLTASSTGEGEHGLRRFRLFEALAALVADATAAAPALFVVDDLHRADAATYSLLAHALRHPRPSRLMVLATASSVPGAARPGLAELIADLRRDHRVDRRTLAGLTVGEVARLIGELGGDPATAADVRLASGGNPFFVEEIVAERSEGGRSPGVPEGVRDVLGRRLARLGDETVAVLAAAAVLGQRFALDLLRVVTVAGPGDLLDRIERTVAAGLVVEEPGEVGRYSFAHALVRRTLEEGLSSARLAQLHLAAAEALGEAPGPERRPGSVGEIAGHRLAALPLGPAAEARAAAVRAGRRALDVAAFEEAAEWGRRAAEVADVADVAGSDGERGEDAAGWAEVELLQADAARAVGRFEAATGHYTAAAAHARRAGDADRLVEAALGCSISSTVGVGNRVGLVDHDLVALLEEGLARADGDVARVRLGAALAVSLYYDPDRARRVALVAEVVDRAERAGDDRLLGLALHARAVALWLAATAVEREVDLARAVGLAEQSDDHEQALRFRAGWIGTLVELGRVADAERELARVAELAELLRQPALRYFPLSCGAMLDILHGRFDEGEAAAQAAARLLDAPAGVNPLGVWVARMFLLAWERGGLAEVAALVDTADGDMDGLLHQPLMRLAATLALADGGHVDDAESRYVQESPRLPPDDGFFLPLRVLRAELAHRFDDRVGARAVLDDLRPYAGRLAQIGTTVCMGPVSRSLGLAAATLGELDAADGWLLQAEDEAAAIDAPSWQARALADRAQVRRRRGGPGDEASAAQLDRRAEELASRLGLPDPATPRYR
jgi:DNA-binding SARP family transcriptional activator